MTGLITLGAGVAVVTGVGAELNGLQYLKAVDAIARQTRDGKI